MEDGILDDKEKRFFLSVDVTMDEITATMAIHQLSLSVKVLWEKRDHSFGRIRYTDAGSIYERLLG